MITTPVPTVALLAAARAMTEPEPPADLGLYRAVRESRVPEPPFYAPPSLEPSGDEPPPSSERRASEKRAEQGARRGELLESEPFEFELTPRSVRNPSAAPPLAEELGLDHLLADFKPQRSWSMWLRSHGVWIVLGALVLWLIVTFAVSWLPG